METQDIRQEAHQCLENLRNVADGLEGMLEQYDEYWTWGQFFRDFKDELIRVKDHVQKTGKVLDRNLKHLREADHEDQCAKLFEKIDKNRSKLKEKGSQIEERADISRIAIEGQNLAEDLREILEIFRDTADLVEQTLEKMD